MQYDNLLLKDTPCIQIVSNSTIEGITAEKLKMSTSALPFLWIKLKDKYMLAKFHIMISKDFKTIVISYAKLICPQLQRKIDSLNIKFTRKISIKNRDIYSSISDVIDEEFQPEIAKNFDLVGLYLIEDMTFGRFINLFERCFIKRFAIIEKDKNVTKRHSVKLLYCPDNHKNYGILIENILYLIDDDYMNLQNNLKDRVHNDIYFVHSRKELLYGFERWISKTK